LQEAPWKSATSTAIAGKSDYFLSGSSSTLLHLYYLTLLDAPERIISKEMWMIRDNLSNCMESISSENLATPTGYDNLLGINPVKGNECSIIASTDTHEANLIEKIERLRTLLEIR
jgi:hypothetical protein